jgi:hypothetical protein
LAGQLVNGEGALHGFSFIASPHSRVMISWIASGRRTDSSPGVVTASSRRWCAGRSVVIRGRQAVPLVDAGEDGFLEVEFKLVDGLACPFFILNPDEISGQENASSDVKAEVSDRLQDSVRCHEFGSIILMLSAQPGRRQMVHYSWILP